MLEEIIDVLGNIKNNDNENKKNYGEEECAKKFFDDINIYRPKQEQSFQYDLHSFHYLLLISCFTITVFQAENVPSLIFSRAERISHI